MTTLKVLVTKDTSIDPKTLHRLASANKGKVVALKGVVVAGGGRWWKRISLGQRQYE